MTEPCVFCRIIDGKTDAFRVYEDEETLAFLDHNPAIKGHTLVVPKKHRSGLTDMSESMTASLFTTARRVAAAAETALDADGVSLFHSSGAAAGQDVFHAHVHLLPRYEGDPINFAPSRQRLANADGEGLATRIRDEL